jgi:hypothetical protein
MDMLASFDPPQLAKANIAARVAAVIAARFIISNILFYGIDAGGWGSRTGNYPARSTASFLTSAIAFAGFRPLGQALAQFMMVWQR